MKQALLVVNFGTSIPRAYSAIAAVEEALAITMNGADVYNCITSPTIRRLLTARGKKVYSLDEILTELAAKDYDLLVVQPTNLLFGIEYDKIRETVKARSDEFKKIVLGSPLLSKSEDLICLAEVLKNIYAKNDCALVLMGHGTDHPANMVYPAFQTVLSLVNYPNAYVGTIEGWPGLDEVISQLKDARESKVLLVPMMLVAGDHAINDMAGDEPDSWKSILTAAGFEVTCHMEGLGLLPEVQSLYCKHLRATLDEIE